MFIKLFSVFILSFSSQLDLSSLEREGWFAVETKRLYQEEGGGEDRALWVLFVKTVGPERFSIRFPEAPRYRYLERGVLEVFAEKEGAFYQLIVGKKGEEQEADSPLTERKGLSERWLQTPHHFYHFKVISNQADSQFSEAFFSSFSIEENRSFEEK